MPIKIVWFHQVFNETSLAIADALDLLDIENELIHNSKSPKDPKHGNHIYIKDNYKCNTEDLYIIVDVHHTPRFPKNYIVVQNEQPGSDWINDNLMVIFDKALGIWDFSKILNRRWQSMGYNSFHVPMRTPLGIYNRIEKKVKKKDIDVLFYGGKKDGRVKMERLIRSKLGSTRKIVFRWFDLFNEEREDFISRSKIVLNLRFWPAGCLQTHRIEYLLARGKCIVSEISGNPELDCDYNQGVIFCETNQMVKTIDKLLKNPAQIELAGIRAKELGARHQFDINPLLIALLGCIQMM
jgi:hypothetical protein